MTDINLEDLTVEQIEQLLNKKRESLKKGKKEYEAIRNKTAADIRQMAEDLRKKMEETKQEMFVKLNHFRQCMEDYTGVPAEEGKSMTVISSDQLSKIMYQVQETNYMDERADEAAERLKTFLATMVKQKSKVAFDLISSLLEKKNGKYDYRLIGRLFNYENDYSDPDWLEAIRLFKESITKGECSSYLRAYKRATPQSKWKPIVLDFADIFKN